MPPPPRKRLRPAPRLGGLRSRRREPNFPRLGFKVLSPHTTPKTSYNASNFVGEGKKIHSAEKKTCSKKGERGINFSCRTTIGINYCLHREVSRQPEAGACGPLGDPQPVPVVPSPAVLGSPAPRPSTQSAPRRPHAPARTRKPRCTTHTSQVHTLLTHRAGCTKSLVTPRLKVVSIRTHTGRVVKNTRSYSSVKTQRGNPPTPPAPVPRRGKAPGGVGGVASRPPAPEPQTRRRAAKAEPPQIGRAHV